jgi:hypothetical protein
MTSRRKEQGYLEDMIVGIPRWSTSRGDVTLRPARNDKKGSRADRVVHVHEGRLVE